MTEDYRTWAYRRGEDGEIEGNIFDAIPEGWVDSPAKVPAKRGRPKKSAD